MAFGMSIGQRLKEFRADKRLTISELANVLNIPVRTLGGYERSEVLPGSKFYSLLIEKYSINVNWLITGIGTMFINQDIDKNEDSISQLQQRINFSNEDMDILISILNSESSRSLVEKLIEIKKGNKEALNSLIANLQGIKAVF